MLRGFFIFLVFICKPKIWAMAQERHPNLWKYIKCCRCCTYWQDNRDQEENSRVSIKFENKHGEVIIPLKSVSPKETPLLDSGVTNNPSDMVENGCALKGNAQLLSARSPTTRSSYVLD